MRFGRRDHESFIGGYDPEHEMPDPDRDPRERWQSDVYRHNARDTRWAYRWNPDRFEDRMEPSWSGPRRMSEREIQPRDRYENRYSAYDRERMGRYLGDYDRGWDYDRGGYGHGAYGGRDWDRDRDLNRDIGRDSRDLDRYAAYDRYGRDRDRDAWSPRDRFDREHFRDDWDWYDGDWSREGRYGRGGGNRY